MTAANAVATYRLLVIEFVLKRLLAEMAAAKPNGVAAGLIDEREAVIDSLLTAIEPEGQDVVDLLASSLLEDAAAIRDALG